ncbi:glycosyltransferase [Anabaena sp. CCY 0017]|uniref:glycosyltransferase n=1 Tax=Anabaena sp. CCY 0017 TaxID=3103866 RepID=UPI0039C67645
MISTQYNDVKQPKIIVISSVSPQPTSAGQVVLYRHLNQVDGWAVSIVPNPDDSKTYKWPTKFIKRLKYTRFHRWSHDLEVIDYGSNWDSVMLNYFQKPFNCQTDDKTIVLTVAHGDGCWAAQKFAQRYQLPLVSIFHDWWPDIPSVHQPLRQVLKKRFQQLYQQSNLALCVSQGMKNALGSHPNSTVLFPIPAMLKEELTVRNQIANNEFLSPLRVIYSGNLYEYGAILAQLLQVTKENPKVHVQVRGSNPNWPADFRSEMRDRGLWLDFAPREELNQWLAAADVFLVTMSFDPALRRRMETSFPSKLTEYAQFGKPLVIWGPDYCSAIHWGRKGDRALCVTDKNPLVMVSALEKLKNSPEQQKCYAQQAKITALTEFKPHIIQNQFLERIENLLCTAQK